MKSTVVLVGTLDTKGGEFAFVRDAIRRAGHDVICVDFGVLGEPAFTPDIERAEVARAGGGDIARMRAEQRKDVAMSIMARGLTAVVRDLHAAGRLDGILGMGGSGGTSIATAAMRALPVGVPKLMVSTVGGGDVAPYAGTRDITFMPSVVDVAGFNRISRRIYANAAGAISGMVAVPKLQEAAGTRLVAVTMFGNTTPAVDRARAGLESAGIEVLVFHATGAGGRTMEDMVLDGAFEGLLDLTTTELADEVCGGVMSAGPDRCLAAPRMGTPVVLVPGCVDMANFAARETVPTRFSGRLLYEWNPNVTLLRTDVAENRVIGEMLARAANAATGPVTVLLPLRGVSMLDSPGGAFWDPDADTACCDAIRQNVDLHVTVVEIDCNINDAEFADRAAGALVDLMSSVRS